MEDDRVLTQAEASAILRAMFAFERSNGWRGPDMTTALAVYDRVESLVLAGNLDELDELAASWPQPPMPEGWEVSDGR